MGSFIDSASIYYFGVGICKIDIASLYVVAELMRLHIPFCCIKLKAVKHLVASRVYRVLTSMTYLQELGCTLTNNSSL